MGRRVALVAEVLQRLDQAASKKRLPVAVHGDPGGERVFWGKQPPGECESVGRGVLWQRWKERGHGWWDLLFWLEVLAAVMPVGGPRMAGGPFLHYQRGLAPGQAAALCQERSGGLLHLWGSLKEVGEERTLRLGLARGQKFLDVRREPC